MLCSREHGIMPRRTGPRSLTADADPCTFETVEASRRARRVWAGDAEGARAAVPNSDALQAVADRFGALSDPTRLRILHALMRAELCVGELATVASRSLPATSQQLKLLRNLGLVKFRSAGKLSYYSLSGEWVRSVLADALSEASRVR
jgi:DNA-binding transcriptional ArsR family regulator